MQARIGRPGRQGGAARVEGRCLRFAAVTQRVGQSGHLGVLLIGERQPAAQVVIERGFRGQAVRHVQRRARRGHGQRTGRAEQSAQGAQRLIEIGAPDIAAVDHTGDDQLVRQLRHRRHSGDITFDEVDGDALDIRPGQRAECGSGVTEIGGDQQRRAPRDRRQAPVHGLGQLGETVDGIGDQRGLIELHPVHTGVDETVEELEVGGQHVVDAGDGGGGAVDGLGQRQERDGADDHRAGGDAEPVRLRDLGENLLRLEGEGGVRADLRDQVVVVGVEPLGHLQRRDVGVAAGGREVAVQRIGDAGHPGGQCVEHHGGVEYLVVVRERVDRDGVESGVGEASPGVAAQPRGRFGEIGCGHAAGPVAFDGALEFAVRPDAGSPEHGGGERPVVRHE